MNNRQGEKSIQKYITDVANAVFSCVLQLAAGSLLSIPVYYIGLRTGSIDIGKNKRLKEILIIWASALLGLLLPLEIYGVIPVDFALLAAGMSFPKVMPLLLSNALFNMLVPASHPMFIWRTGWLQMALALLAGGLGGLLLRGFKESGNALLKSGNVPLKEQYNRFSWQSLTGLIRDNLRFAGIYLVLGTSLNELLNGYLIWPVLDFLYTNEKTAFLPVYFSGLNVVNPIFLQAMNIVYTLMNLTVLSGFFAVLKIKGVFLCFLYYAAITALLGLTAFL